MIMAVNDVLKPCATLRVSAQPAFIVPRGGREGIYHADAEVDSWLAGKEEEPAEAAELTVWELRDKTVTSEIEISTSLKWEWPMAVSQVYAALDLHLRGVMTPLLGTGWSNIFRVLDKEGELRSLHARFFPSFRGWSLRAYRAEDCQPILIHPRVVSY
jgi:hypothetical protein